MQGKGPHRSLNARKAGSPAATVGAACCPGTHRHCKTIEEAGGGGEGVPGLLLISHPLIFYWRPYQQKSLGQASPWATAEQGKGRDGSES